MSQQWMPKWKKASADPAPIQAMSSAAGPVKNKEWFTLEPNPNYQVVKTAG